MFHRLFDLAFAVAVLIGSIILWLVADDFPTSQKYERIDTDFWPKFVYSSLSLLSAILVLQHIISIRKVLKSNEQISINLPETSVVLKLAVTSALIVVYFLALQWVGFVIATILFLWAASFIFPYENLKVKIIFAPVFTLALTIFFGLILKLPLPRGSGYFYELNLNLF